MQHMGDTFKNVALPALALGAGTGALTGYLSSQGNQQGETGSARRHRILRNALVGAALGGTAGMALPMGYEALNTPLHPGADGLVGGATNSAVGFAGRHLLPAAAGIGGGFGLLRPALKADRHNALEFLRQGAMHSGDPGDMAMFMDKDKGRTAVSNLASREGGAYDLSKKYRQGLAHIATNNAHPEKTDINAVRKSDLGSIFRANELMQEAGQKGMSYDEMKAKFENEAREGMSVIYPKRMIATNPGEVVRTALLGHMRDSGIVGKGVAGLAGRSRLPFADFLSKLPGLSGAATYDPIHLAEAYSKYVRPSVRNITGGPIMGRLPAPLKWGLLGGGVLAANELQNRLAGD